MSARRDKTAQRAWQDSPVAKRRARKLLRIRQERIQRRQRHERRKRKYREALQTELANKPEGGKGGAAAAERGAEGDARREGRRRLDVARE